MEIIIEKSKTIVGMYIAKTDRKGDMFYGAGRTPELAKEDLIEKVRWFEDDFQQEMKQEGEDVQRSEREEIDRDEDTPPEEHLKDEDNG